MESEARAADYDKCYTRPGLAVGVIQSLSARH